MLQSKLLVDRLRKTGYKVQQTSFPRYATSEWGKLIARFLNGEFGKMANVNAYYCALPYMLDEYTWSRDEGRKLLQAGYVVVTDRYFTSNVHQVAKMKGTAKAKFRTWLWHTGYDLLGIVKPDLVLFLNVPANTARGLLRKKGEREYLKSRKKDIAENDTVHQTAAHQEYVHMTKMYKYWKNIACTEQGMLDSHEVIAERIWKWVVSPWVMDELMKLVKQEEQRQQETVMLIPSENYASQEVRAALGSRLVNKYSEGYPGKRYYQGNKYIDEIETLAIERAKELFGVNFANVQPYSGSPANAAAIMAMTEPGEKIMGLKLSGGGHLTHGHPKITFSGKFFESIQYDVNEDGWIDYGQVAKLAQQERPKLIIVGTTAYPRILEWKKFREIADSIGALILADISHIAGLVIGGVHPSPAGYADVIMTTTHKTLRGPRGAMLLTDTEELAKKIDKAVFPGLQGGPHDNQTAAIAIALGEAATPEFKSYAQQIVINAKVLSEELVRLGLTLSTGGTDNHLMVIDLRPQGVGGKEIATRLEDVGIVLNYNSVPHDTNPPANPSGIRLGTPAVTTRGMREKEMRLIAKWIAEIILRDPSTSVGMTKVDVETLCQAFPMP